MLSTDHFRLSDEMLARFHERAPIYDRENRFFSEDFEELRAAGYLLSPVPKELGGKGLTLSQLCLEQRRLARFAPATALAVGMHLYLTGAAVRTLASGNKSFELIVREVAAGEVLAAGHGERGTDIPVFLSTTQAKRVPEGYALTGHKLFTSLSPVWTRLCVHGMDASEPQAPKIVHGFLPRNAAGIAVCETWDTLGMRPTRSDDTILTEAVIPERYIACVVPAGATADQFVTEMYLWSHLLLANVYYGVAQRAYELALEHLKGKTSLAMTRSMAYHPEAQHTISEMVIVLESIGPQLERLAHDWENNVDHGPLWGAKIAAAKVHAVEGSFRVVDMALDILGGTGFHKKSELERLFRDCRAGRIHPLNSALAHELIAKTVLGISPNEQPRWG